MLRKLIVEAIGTFFLVLTIGLVVTEPGAGALAPLAIGAVLMVLVYAGGHISGAHYNPAVTLAVLLRGKATLPELGGYWLAQLTAAACAPLVLSYLKPAQLAIASAPAAGPLFVAELLFTFVLAYVILNVATTRGTEGNSYYGLAIGLTVTAGAYAVGPISGAVFNPAVGLGVTLAGLSAPGVLWVIIAANISGGIAAALLFNALDMGDDKATTATPAEQARLQGAAEPGR